MKMCSKGVFSTMNNSKVLWNWNIKQFLAAIIGYILVFIIIPQLIKIIVGYEVLSISIGVFDTIFASIIAIIISNHRT